MYVRCLQTNHLAFLNWYLHKKWIKPPNSVVRKIRIIYVKCSVSCLAHSRHLINDNYYYHYYYVIILRLLMLKMELMITFPLTEESIIVYIKLNHMKWIFNCFWPIEMAISSGSVSPICNGLIRSNHLHVVTLTDSLLRGCPQTYAHHLKSSSNKLLE